MQLLFFLNRADPTACDRMFHMAKLAAEADDQVDIFLMDDAVVYADKTNPFHTDFATLTGDRPSDHLPRLQELDVYVHVCTPCAKARDVIQANLIENALFSNGHDYLNMVHEYDKVLTF